MYYGFWFVLEKRFLEKRSVKMAKMIIILSWIVCAGLLVFMLVKKPFEAFTFWVSIIGLIVAIVYLSFALIIELTFGGKKEGM